MEEEKLSQKERVLGQIRRHLQDSSEEKLDLPTATSILVSGITKNLHVNSEDLFHYFSRMGQIKRMIPRSIDKQLEIIYVRRSSALEAVQRLNGTSFQGDLLNVQFKQTTRDRHSSSLSSPLNHPKLPKFPNRKSTTVGRRQRNFRHVQILDNTIT